MSNHTPGPWHVWEADDSQWWICETQVARTRHPHFAAVSIGAWGPEGKANARLIAAAPELLEALTRMVALFDSGAWSHANIKDARAAIAKAEGT